MMNWDDARVFLALCREQTLRGAARVLAVDQATVGRRLASLERSLEATLFLRTSAGYSLTAAGEIAMARRRPWSPPPPTCNGRSSAWTSA